MFNAYKRKQYFTEEPLCRCIKFLYLFYHWQQYKKGSEMSTYESDSLDKGKSKDLHAI